MTPRIEPARRAPRLPVDWRPARRDLGPPTLSTAARVALLVLLVVALWIAR